MVGQLTLTATEGVLKGQEFVLTAQTVYLVGRSHQCGLRLPAQDLTASRQHCLLEVDAPRVCVVDLGSLNGTYVNGQLIGPRSRDSMEGVTQMDSPSRWLADGDQFQVGHTVFRVKAR